MSSEASAGQHGADRSLLEDVALLIVHYNTPRQTQACLQSAAASGFSNIQVLDNASEEQAFAALQSHVIEHGLPVELHRSERNLGFAGGCNWLIQHCCTAQSKPPRWFFLLNSDTELNPDAMPALIDALTRFPERLIAARMHLRTPDEGTNGLPAAEHHEPVESLGLCCYRSLFAGNRKSAAQPCIGPTGGCAVLPLGFLTHLQEQHGHVFDEDFFCYAEDFDLAVRAQLTGHDVYYIDTLLAWHEGQASVGNRDFIAYHGLRNSLWVHMKSLPLSLVLAHLPWLLFALAGISLQYIVQRRFLLLCRVYRDAFIAMPRMLRKRRRIMSNSPPGAARRLKAVISKQFYEQGYLKRLILRR